MLKEKLRITGVLLVGGESRRMGKNKALLEIEGKPLIQRNLEVLDSVCSQVLISSREANLYTGYGYEVIPDVVKGKGPLVGLCSALRQADYEHIFLVACDMPLLNQHAIRFIWKRVGDFDAAVPYALGKIHPLHAVYHKRTLPIIEENLQKETLKITQVVYNLKTNILRIEDEATDSMEEELILQSLSNVNTPEEWETLLGKVIYS